MKRFLVFIYLLLSALQGEAQEISGTWVGNYSNAIGMTQPRKLVVELSLHRDGSVSGSSHLYYDYNQYEHYTIKGKYRASDSTIYFYEDKTLGIDLGGNPNILGKYAMRLKVSGNKFRFQGKWKANDKNGPYQGISMGVWLEKPLPPKPMVAKSRTNTPAIPRPKDKNLERATNVQSLIEIAQSERDSIKVELMDNMVVDGDVVSVYVNDRQVVNKQPLTKQPITFYVTVKKTEPICKIKMVAENLGTNPPCTALMRVTVNGKKHEVTLSSNFANTGTLELFLKE